MKVRSAFTIVELLVSVSVIAMLIGILLPAIGKAVDYARLIKSQANLRQLGQAANIYASEWNDRQFTVVDDNLSRYGNNPAAALQNYMSRHGVGHPRVACGYGQNNYPLGWRFDTTTNITRYGPLLNPITFDDGSWYGVGWFRVTNVQGFNSYLNGKMHDPVFWAPKDRIVYSYLEQCLESPYGYDECFLSSTPGPDGDGNQIYPTYVFSPAALVSPDVMRTPEDDGFQNPWTLGAGLRCPSMSQARKPDLKTHMLEHHWLQQARADCNPAFPDGTYNGCEPYYFNHSWESVPVTLFYDGHVEGLGVREAEAADTRARVQSGHGLWSRDTPFGNDGYFIPEGYDFAATSFHILTTDGIRGRDKMAK